MESTNQFLKPLTTMRNEAGNLEIGGCDLVELAEKYGTPLYVIDEHTLRSICADYKKAFSKYEKVNMMFASKSLCTMATSAILAQEDSGLTLFQPVKFILSIRPELICRRFFLTAITRLMMN